MATTNVERRAIVGVGVSVGVSACLFVCRMYCLSCVHCLYSRERTTRETTDASHAPADRVPPVFADYNILLLEGGCLYGNIFATTALGLLGTSGAFSFQQNSTRPMSHSINPFAKSSAFSFERKLNAGYLAFLCLFGKCPGAQQ